MEGLVVEVDPERCRGCGKCVEACILRQLRLVEREPAGDSRAAAGPATSAGQGAVAAGEGSSAPSKGSSKQVPRVAAIGEECKGCGRCAMVCPEKAVRIRMEDPAYIGACVRRISSSVKVR